MKRRYYPRAKATERSAEVESRVVGVCGDRVLIHARWQDGDKVKGNLLSVTRKYWVTRYGLQPEEAMR